MKNARGTHQEQENFTKKTTPGNRSSDTLTAACFWCRDDHPSPRQQHCPAFRKRCNKCGIIGHFAGAYRGGARTGRRLQQQSNFVQDDPDEEAFVVNCQAALIGARKFFTHLHLIHGGQSKVVQVQIDSVSTCNTMPTSVLNQVFPGYEDLLDGKQNQHLRKPNNETKRSSNSCVRKEGQIAHD